MTTEIKIQQEVYPIVQQANTLNIKSVEDMTRATDILSTLNRFTDKIKEERERITRPALDIIAEERARWKPIETPVVKAINNLRTKISAYQTAVIAERKAQEEKIASRVAPGKGNLSVASAVAKLANIPAVVKTVETQAGVLKFRTDFVLTIINADLIPREYLSVDEARVKSALKEGKEVPGARLVERQVPVNMR